MATRYDVNFRADGDVTAEVVGNDQGNACLRVTSRRQSIEVSFTGEQADVVQAAVAGYEAKPPAKKPSAKETTKKKAAKKAAKKTTKKKAAKKR